MPGVMGSAPLAVTFKVALKPFKNENVQLKVAAPAAFGALTATVSPADIPGKAPQKILRKLLRRWLS
jgi:hypothetical protein